VSTDYDVIVLGAGAAGEHCAGVLAAGGLDVAIIECELVAGECSYYACIPSKSYCVPARRSTPRSGHQALRKPSEGAPTRRPRLHGATTWSLTTTTPDRSSGSRIQGSI